MGRGVVCGSVASPHPTSRQPIKRSSRAARSMKSSILRSISANLLATFFACLYRETPRSRFEAQISSSSSNPTSVIPPTCLPLIKTIMSLTFNAPLDALLLLGTPKNVALDAGEQGSTLSTRHACSNSSRTVWKPQGIFPVASRFKRIKEIPSAGVLCVLL